MFSDVDAISILSGLLRRFYQFAVRLAAVEIRFIAFSQLHSTNYRVRQKRRVPFQAKVAIKKCVRKFVLSQLNSGITFSRTDNSKLIALEFGRVSAELRSVRRVHYASGRKLYPSQPKIFFQRNFRMDLELRQFRMPDRKTIRLLLRLHRRTKQNGSGK